jgi:hypothetical protein
MEAVLEHKLQIDKLLRHYNYRDAFKLLVITLQNLDNNDRNILIQYYNNFISNKYFINETSMHPVSRY